MNKKILFIQPSIYDDWGRVVKKKKLYFVGLADPVLASLLPEGWTAEICIETIEDIPYDTDADVIGIGGMGHAANRGKDIALEFKKRGKIVYMGGPMVSLVPELAREYCDSVMIGDSEESIVEMCHDLERGELKPIYNRPITLATSFQCKRGGGAPTPAISAPSTASTGGSTSNAPSPRSSGTSDM